MSIPGALMQETLTVYPYGGHGAYGPVYGASYEIVAYLEPGYRRVTNARGEEVIASALAICPATPALSPNDRVAWGSRHYAVIDAQPMRPQGATHHQEVYLQSEVE